MVTYKDNLRYEGNVPLAVYIDFETTTPTDACLNPEDKKKTCMLFPMLFSYVIIFVFHLNLKMQRVNIECSFGHS